MEKHPRFKYFPWQEDYTAQPNVFCPHVMSVAQPGYTSSALNIDKFGFRIQYDSSGEIIDLETIRDSYDECLILLGNSTAFGVSVTADACTLGHLLVNNNILCINLSVRGATIQQELAIFLALKHLLPPVRQIILLSGICDVSLATQPEDIWFDNIGGLHSSDNYFKQHHTYTALYGGIIEDGKELFLQSAENRYLKSCKLQKIYEKKVRKGIPSLSKESFELNLKKIFPIIRNTLQTWGWIKKSINSDISFILQPVLGWTIKPMTEIEVECRDADRARIAAIDFYTNRHTHHSVHTELRSACLANSIRFFDANYYFDTLDLNKGTLFSDICHLTDDGTKILAKWICTHILD